MTPEIRLDPCTTAEVALARATIADRALALAESRAEVHALAADVLDALGLTLAEAGPRLRLADLEWRPDRHLKRAADAPAAAAPPSPEVARAREAARQRRREAAAEHFRAQGLSGAALKNALRGMGL